jgi:peptidoglycan/LPS O-acetylase OafA/YrhL
MDREVAATPSRHREAVARFNRPVHGARGLFASAVYVFHVVNSGLATWPFLQTFAALFLLRTTEYGVELFFCISGYVICGTLRRARSPGAFLEDRAVRIFPVLWSTIFVIVALGLVTGVRGWAAMDKVTLLWELPANLLVLPGIFPIHLLHPAAWSLSYEMCFYLACALLWSLRLWGGRRAVWAMVPAAAAMLALDPRGLPFLSGVLVAEGYLSSPRLAGLLRYPLPLLLIFLMAWHEIQILSLPNLLILTNLFEWAHDFRLPLAILAFVAATLAFGGIAAGHGLLGRFLRTPVLQYLGTISYSFYLWHPIVMSGVKIAMIHTGLAAAAGYGAQALFLVLALPPSLLLAHASQRVLERGAGIWLRHRLHHPVPLQTAALATEPRL